MILHISFLYVNKAVKMSKQLGGLLCDDPEHVTRFGVFIFRMGMILGDVECTHFTWLSEKVTLGLRCELQEGFSHNTYGNTL